MFDKVLNTSLLTVLLKEIQAVIVKAVSVKIKWV